MIRKRKLRRILMLNRERKLLDQESSLRELSDSTKHNNIPIKKVTEPERGNGGRRFI